MKPVSINTDGIPGVDSSYKDGLQIYSMMSCQKIILSKLVAYYLLKGIEILRKNIIKMVSFISLFLCSSVFAATVSVVAEKSLDYRDQTSGGRPYIYFDASNQIHLAFQSDVAVDTNAVTNKVTNPVTGILTDKIPYISAATQDSENQLIYFTTRNYDGDYNKLYKFNIKSREYTELAKLPRQRGWFFTMGIPADTKVILLTPDKKYLVLLTTISSRMDGHDILMVYDLENSKWIYEKRFGSGHGGQLIIGKGNNIGLYYYDQSQNKYRYSHYLIR